jgi:hypothetical protein
MSNSFIYTEESEVFSSLASRVYYNADTLELAVEFKQSDGLAIYVDVAPNVYQSLVNSSSVGDYYNRYIKNQYKNKFGSTVYNYSVTEKPKTVFDSISALDESNVAKSEYLVRGIMKFERRVSAESVEDAIEEFSSMLIEDGYDADNVDIKQVVVFFE